MTARPEQTMTPRRTRRAALIAAAAVAGVAAVAAVYGVKGLARNADEAACGAALQTAQRLAPLARGEVAAVAVADQPRRIPELAFKDPGGGEKTLADWRGRVVLLNLWATWCVPCRKEMPALDALQQDLGGERFEVVAVNIDTRNPDKPRSWLQEVGIKSLGYYSDPSAKVFQDLKLIGKAFGMPTTLLVDGQGCEIASLAGPAEWASADALALVRAALER
jgi:thiol-disulfide isomerase/thioredoxin